MSRLFLFWLSHRVELAGLLAQHVMLVAVSTLAAVALGVPLGIFAARRPRLSAPVVGFANLVQTVPSLAMFGFLLPAILYYLDPLDKSRDYTLGYFCRCEKSAS